ncbi:hypothetical protein [Oleidesulfovibrio sp.]|uniref:hypothetical protein n=1 Tax=Oleidesulfovibrio sp. TaxID=2909707 RepID=UPI003A867BA6
MHRTILYNTYFSKRSLAANMFHVTSAQLAQPEFYVASPHGAGLQSFLYYLRLMGIPSTYWWDQEKSFAAIRRQHSVCGFTIDCRLSVGEHDPFQQYLSAHRPLFGLSRDPVNIIVTILNMQLGDALIEGARTNSIERVAAQWHEKLSTIDSYKPVIHGKYYFPYRAIMRRVQNPDACYIIDTSDLLPDDVIKTMSDVYYRITGTQYCNIEHLSEIMRRSYNNFQNRAWSRFINDFTISVNNVPVKVMLTPAPVADFHLPFHGCTQFHAFRYNNEDYVMGLLINPAGQNIAQEFYAHYAKQIECFVDTGKRTVATATQYFEQLRITVDDIIQLFQQNKDKVAGLIKMQQATRRYFQNELHHHADWKCFDRLCQKMDE